MGRLQPWTMLLAVAALGLASLTSAETVLQLNGATSYIESGSFEDVSNGVMSFGTWFWPEGSSDSMEALMSVAVSGKGKAVTVGMTGGKMYFSDMLHEASPAVSDVEIESKTWHYMVLTLDPIDRGVYQSADGTLPRHRLGSVYVDGTVVLTFETRLPLMNDATMTVGADYHSGSLRRFFAGLIDEPKVYSKTLTADEVATYSFIKEGDETEAASHFTVVYSTFNEISADATAVVTVKDIAQNSMTMKVHYCDAVTVDMMPYDSLDVTSYTQTNPFTYTKYDDSLTNFTGPLSGATLTVIGSNFADTAFLAVHVVGEDDKTFTGTAEYVGYTEMRVHLPPVSIAIGETSETFTVHVCNGGMPHGNCGSFTFTYMYVVGEDWADDLVAFYKFDGSLANAADRYDDAMTATIPANYGNGGPFYAPSRSLDADSALVFVKGERVSTPVLIGDRASWSMCAWVYAEPEARTLFYERDAAKENVAHLIQLDAEGTLYLDGEAGASLHFNAWQFVCISSTPSLVTFYVGGLPLATAVPVAMPDATMEVGLIGTNWVGVVDDFWVLDRELTDYDVMTVYTSEEFAVALDGDAGHFTVKNGAYGLDSSEWRSGDFSIEMWVNAATVSSVQPLYHQDFTVTDPSGYQGIYLGIKADGNVVFYGASGTAEYKMASTQAAPITAGTWHLITVSYSVVEMMIFVDGVAQSVTDSGSTTFSTGGALTASANVATVGYGVTGTVTTATADDFTGSFEGMIGEVRLWSKALTVAEATGTTCSPMMGDTDLYAYFKLDDASGSLYYGNAAHTVKMEFSGPLRPYWVASNYTSTNTTTTELYMPNSEAGGAGLEVGEIETVNTFTFQARDMCNRILKFEDTPMQLVVSGPMHTHEFAWLGAITANGDGTYTGAYETTMCGYYALRVEMGPTEGVEGSGVPLPTDDNGDWYNVFNSGNYDKYMAKGSPYKAYVNPGATVASMSYAYDAPDLLENNDLQTAYYGAPAVFTVQAADKYGCKATKGGDEFEVTMTGRYEKAGSVVDHDDGTYSVTYVPYLQGSMQLQVTHKGMDVGGHADEDPKNYCGVSLGDGFGGSPWMIDVQQGAGSLEFHGMECMEAASEEQLALGFEFTLETFIFPMAPYQDGKILSKESAVSGHGYYVAVVGSHIVASLYVGGTEIRTLTSTSMLTPDTWSHVAVTYDGTVLKIFIDGVQDARVEFSGRKDVKENAQKLVIGYGLTALLDEIRIVPYAKGMATVADLMKCPMSAESVSFYLMANDGAGSVAFDYSSYGNSATKCAAGGPTWNAANAPYMVNELDWDKTVTSGDGLIEARVGVPAAFRVDLKDACGFDYAATEVTAEVGLNAVTMETASHGEATCPEINLTPLGEVSITHEMDATGVAPLLVTYHPEMCGEGAVQITVDGLSPSPIPLAVPVKSLEETAAATSQIVDAPGGAVAGLATSFGIKAYDRFGCARTMGGDADAFQVLLTRTSAPEGQQMLGSDAMASKLTPIDHGDGTYTMYFTAPAAGTYVLDVGFHYGPNITALAGSPHTFETSSAPWRSALLPSGTASPDARYDPTTAVYKEEMYVFRGYGADKSALTDVHKYSVKASPTTTWAYRTLVTVTGMASAHEVRVVVDTAALVGGGKMRADCADVLFLPVGADVGASPIGYFMDPGPGCNAETTGFWLSATPDSDGTFEVYMYYGNVYAASTAVSGSAILSEYDDFEYDSSPLDNGWELAATCSLPLGDPAAFSTDAFTSVTGSRSLKVDSLTKAGGSLTKAVTPMASYVIKAFLYDSDAESSANWISPNFDDCTDLQNTKMLLPDASALGVFSCTTSSALAMLYPWGSTTVERKCGWRALEMVSDGSKTQYYVDSQWVGERPSAPLNRLFIRGGANAKAEQGEFETIAAWDSVYAAAFDPAVTVTVAAEEPVTFNTKQWKAVTTSGTAPPVRSSDAAVQLGNKLYMAGGFTTSAAAESVVWHYDFSRSTWGSVTPWGSARLPAREHHTLALYGDVMYAFGGRSGASVFSDTWAYSISDNAWSLVAAAGTGPSARFGHSASVYKDTMYVFGGFANGTASGETWALDLLSNTWMDLTPAVSPAGRFSHTTAVQEDTLFLYGGATLDSVLHDSWKYDFDYNVWSPVTPSSLLSGEVAAARSENGLAVHDNTLYAFGGRGATAFFQDLWSLAVY